MLQKFHFLTNLDQLTVKKNNEVWKRVCRKEYEVYLEWKLEQYMKSLKVFSPN